MSLDNLPVEWFETTLDQIAEWGSGGTPSRKNSTYYGGDVPWIKTGDLGEKYVTQATEFITDEAVKNSSAKYFKKGSVIMAMYGATIGKTSILGIDATTNQACAVGTPIATSTEFLYYFLRNEKDAFIAKGKGGAQPNISQQIIKAHTVYLPALAEQQEIVRQLDVMLAQVEQIKARLDAIPAILKKFRQSVLADAVSGKLTEEWREKNAVISTKDLLQQIQAHKKEWVENNADHPESKRIKKRLKEFQPSQTGNALYPKTWHECCLEDIVLMIVDCHNKTAPYVESGIPLIRTSNIRDGKVRWEDLRFVDEPTYEYWSRRAKPESGDLIFTREAPMGEVCIIPDDQIFCLGQRTMLIKPIHELCIKNYLLLNILSDIFKKRNEEFAIGTGVKHYRVGDVSNFKIPLAPLEEQKVIVQLVSKYIGVADHISNLVESAQKRVNLLTQSILAKAFSGELTAEWREQHQDLITGVNSAETLLAKIQAEREVNKPVKKTRKKKEV